jgi:hypothetical protein
MPAFATLLTPVDASPAIELGNTWSKRILPVGEIEYQGRTLKFSRAYLQGLAAAFAQRAYDQVPLQFADAANTHTNDPERTRGWVTGMELGDDGLYITAELTDRGQEVLSQNPYLGVSARIVEQFQRSDGQFFPAAIQHVLGTLDPRIPGLGAWQEVQLSSESESSVTIDLSSYSFSGQPATAPAADVSLSPQELDDLISAISEANAEEAYGPDFSGAAGEFDAAFSARTRADAAREQARAALDALPPAVRQEDKVARAISRAGHGLYDGQPQMSFAAEQAAVEILMANGGNGPCGPVDEFGRCSARYHDLECGTSQNTDWLASGPPRSTYAASLANFADGLQLDLAPRTVWDDPDDYDQAPAYMPARTVELAHQLAHDWGLDAADVPGFPGTMTGFTDLLRPPGAPVSMQDELLSGMGYELPAADRPSYPGVAQLAQDLGLK